MQVIPAVDVLEGRVVRLLRGDYERVTVYSEDPGGMARRWVEEGAELLHVVDLAGARSGSPDSSLWRTLREAGARFQVGGGLRTEGDVRSALEAGADRVVLGTAAVWSPELLPRLVEAWGADRLVAAVDVSGGRARGSGWKDRGRELEEVLGAVGEAGLTRAMVTAVARDGTLAGPDLGLLTDVVGRAPGLAMVASGGVGSLDDLRALRDVGVEAAVVGRALYEGRFTLAEAVAIASG